MEEFSFRVEEILQDFGGFEGVMLAGPVLEDAYNLTVGDLVAVPGRHRDLLATCTAFPLANWGSHRRDWVTITVSGLSESDVLKGGVARSTGRLMQRRLQTDDC